MVNPEFFDVHAHVNFAVFEADKDEVIKRALEGGVWLANVGTQTDTSRKAIEIAEKYERGVYAIVGLHPIHTAKSFHDKQELGPSYAEATAGKDGGFVSCGEIFDSAMYRSMAEHPKVVAIGECGLDYFRSFEVGKFTSWEVQEKAFRSQIELAIEVGKPLMLHLRNGSGRSAYKDAFSILSSYFPARTERDSVRSGGLLPSSHLRGNLHFFAGSIEEAKPFLDLGFSFSFTGVITFARDYDEVIRYLPLDRIMSETDCPYVAPAPYRGKRNEPLYVERVAEAVAEIKKTNVELVKASLASNAQKFFKLNIPTSV